MPSSITVATRTPDFDPAAGSTVNVGIDPSEALVPDVTKFMKETAFVSIMTPLGNPFDPTCIWGAPVCYWGLPATAKSEKIEQAALEANLPYATIYPGQRQPEDFSGVLVPTPTGVVIECLIGAVRWLNPLKRGVIFVDEMNGATRATQGAMLGFLQKRVIGDSALAPGIRILAAANPPKWSTSGFTLASPTANRMCHLQVHCPPVDEWIHHMISEEVKPQFDAASTEDLIRAKWGAVYSHVKALFVGYMKSRPQMLHIHPNIDSAQAGYCWPSTRTWKLAARIKATAEILGQAETVSHTMVEGCVGEGAAADFYIWARSADLPTPQEVLKMNWTPDRRRLDIAFAVLTSVTQYVLSIQDKKEATEVAIGAWRLYSNFIEASLGDMTVSAAHSLATRGLSRSTDLNIRSVADPVIRYLAENKLLKYVPQ